MRYIVFSFFFSVVSAVSFGASLPEIVQARQNGAILTLKGINKPFTCLPMVFLSGQRQEVLTYSVSDVDVKIPSDMIDGTYILRVYNSCDKTLIDGLDYILVGFSGLHGEEGDVGLKGPLGARGATGAQGFPGEQGAVGEEGVVGEQGSEGPRGPEGSVGIQGLKGAEGDAGPQGYPGLDGVLGPKGPSGVAGLPGTEQGPTGDKGMPGDKGVPGVKGFVGDRGRTPLVVVGFVCTGENNRNAGVEVTTDYGTNPNTNRKNVFAGQPSVFLTPFNQANYDDTFLVTIIEVKTTDVKYRIDRMGSTKSWGNRDFCVNIMAFGF